jgi:hypothetical protein
MDDDEDELALLRQQRKAALGSVAGATRVCSRTSALPRVSALFQRLLAMKHDEALVK